MRRSCKERWPSPSAMDKTGANRRAGRVFLQQPFFAMGKIRSLCTLAARHVDDRDASIGVVAHLGQQLRATTQRDGVGYQSRRIQSSGSDQPQHPRVIDRLHTVAAVDLQFACDDGGHGDRRIRLRSQHQADLHMPAPLGQTGYRIPTRLVMSQRIDRYVRASARNLPNTLHHIHASGVDRFGRSQSRCHGSPLTAWIDSNR